MTAYTKIAYVNDTTPALNATNLNHGEAGIGDAHTELSALETSFTGIIMYFPASSVPTGWIKCNGQSLSTTEHSTLFSVIGYTYGGNGGLFNVPDLRGKFIRGWDHGRLLDSGRTFGSYQDSDVAWHRHTYEDDTVADEGQAVTEGWPNWTGQYSDTPRTTGSTGGTESRPKNTALIACIHG